MELPEQAVIEEECWLDSAPYPDLPPLYPSNDNEGDGSEFKVDAAANHKHGLVFHREDGGTVVVSDYDESLNEDNFGNASVVSTRQLNHETSLDNGDAGKVPFHGFIREKDAAAGESAETVPNARYEGADKAMEGKVLVQNGNRRDIRDAVKGECYPSEVLENSETPFSLVQNLGVLVDTLVPVVESDKNSKTSSTVTGECVFATDFGGVLESVAHDETVSCPRESECSPNSADVGEIHVQSSDMASGSRNFLESNFILSHDDCCSTDVNHNWDEYVEPSAAAASIVSESLDVDGRVEFHLQTVQRDSEDEANVAREELGTADIEVPASTSLGADSDHCSNNESGSSIEKVIYRESTLCDVETVHNVIAKGKKEGSLVYHRDGHAERYDEHVSLLKEGEISFGTVDSIIKIRSVGQSLNAPASNSHVPETEVEICQVEAVFEGSKPKICDMELVGVSRSASEASTEPECKHNGFVEPSAFNPLSSEKVKENFPNIYGSYLQARFAVNADVDGNTPPANSDLKLKPAPPSNCGETQEVRVSPCGNAELKLQEADEKGDQVDDSTRSPNWKTLSYVNQKPQNVDANNVSDAAPENNTKSLDEGEARRDTKTKPFNFLVRIPRSDDSSIREQIRLAKMHVDEKTKHRDAIQDHIQRRRANSQVYATDYECAKVEARNARKLVRLKRIEIDSLNSVINNAKNVMSIKDIDIQIRKMENMIQHETLPLKEEKLLIREIKQLKQLREQLSSSLGNQDEINQALEQREDVEERLKALRKELDILKDGVLKAEEAAIEAGKKYETENSDIKELRSRFRDADDIRHAAFSHLQNLKKELWKKNKLFFKYTDDATVANYAFGGNIEALLCLDQVENFMDMWNTNKAFRNEYAVYSAKSALRRFESLDARTVCIDVKRVILPSSADGGVDTIISKAINSDVRSVNSFSDSNEETSFTTVAPDGGSTSEVPEIQYQEVDGPVREDQHNEANHEVYEEPEITMSMEEVESLRKLEEQRMQEAEVEQKEQRRLEELAKANEARERKRRQLEKLQMRAEMKTLKEAQQKEKEREKRLRKKERKMASISDTSDIRNHCETSPSSDKGVMELTKEIETCAITRKPQKRWLFSKHKSKSVPPPLRNRNKKKWQQCMWVGATSLFVLVLFCLGNAFILSSVNLKRPSPGY